MDGVWRLKSEAVGELSIGRRVPSFDLFNEGPAETIFQHAIPIKLLAKQHSGRNGEPCPAICNEAKRPACEAGYARRRVDSAFART